MGACGPIFVSWIDCAAAAAAALRFLRLRRHTRAIAPMMPRITMGTAAAAAYTDVLLVSFLDQFHPEGRPPNGPAGDGDGAPVRVSERTSVNDNGSVVPASGYGVSVMLAAPEIDVSQLFVVVGVGVPGENGGQGSVDG